jgi:hypothetical protein
VNMVTSRMRTDLSVAVAVDFLLRQQPDESEDEDEDEDNGNGKSVTRITTKRMGRKTRAAIR